MALDATIGGTSSDSYTTVAAADAYHATTLNATVWDAADTATKEKGLKMATRLFDQRIDWVGSKFEDAQALRWPRSGVTDLDGYSVGTDEIPTAITEATAEFAKRLIDTDTTGQAEGKGVASLKAGSVALTFDKTDTADVLPDIVSEMLRGWGTIHARSKFGTVAVVRS